MSVRKLATGAAVLVLCLPGIALAQVAPVQVTKVRDLFFGYCANVGGTSYTVDAAETVGAAACQGATSARFEVTGDPNARVRITLDNNVAVTNGVESLTVRTANNAQGPFVRLDAAGTATLYVGGTVNIPGGGLTSFGDFTAAPLLVVEYK